MFDLPSAAARFRREGSAMTSFEREESFELMLTAVEENSGHMIVLATVQWSHVVDFQVDVNREVHSRLKLKGLETTYRFNGG